MILNDRPLVQWDCYTCGTQNETPWPSFIADLTSPEDLGELGDHLPAEGIERLKSLGKYTTIFFKPKHRTCWRCHSTFTHGTDTNGSQSPFPVTVEVPKEVPAPEPEPAAASGGLPRSGGQGTVSTISFSVPDDGCCGE